MPTVQVVHLITLDAPLLQLLQKWTSQPVNFQTTLDRIEKKVDALTVTEQEFKAVLAKIDATTTGEADNITKIAAGVTAVGAEVDDLLAKLQNAGVSQDIVDSATAIQAKLDALSTSTEPIVTNLTAIAAKGSTTVPPPTPAPSV